MSKFSYKLKIINELSEEQVKITRKKLKVLTEKECEDIYVEAFNYYTKLLKNVD